MAIPELNQMRRKMARIRTQIEEQYIALPAAGFCFVNRWKSTKIGLNITYAQR